MYRRVITAVLRLFVPGHATAQAYEWHAVDMADHVGVTEDADAGTHADSDGCDHCWHVGAQRLTNEAAVFATRSVDPPIAYFRSADHSSSVNSLSLEGEGRGEGGSLLILLHFMPAPWPDEGLSGLTGRKIGPHASQRGTRDPN